MSNEVSSKKAVAVKHPVLSAYFMAHMDIPSVGLRSIQSVIADEFTQLELIPEHQLLKIIKLDRSLSGKSVTVYVPLSNVRNLVMV